MRKLVAVMIGVALLSGCVAYDAPYGDGRPYGYTSDGRQYYPVNPRDRDGDGVRNSRDRRPDNPNRY